MSADGVVDWIHVFSIDEASIVSQVLLWLANGETCESPQEAQLHALAELAETGHVPRFVLAQIGSLTPTNLAGSSLEHYAYLSTVAADTSRE